MTMNKIACHWIFFFWNFVFFGHDPKSQVQYIFNLLSAGIMQILGHATMQLLHLKRPKLIEHNVSVFRAQAWNELVRHSLEYPVSSSKRAFCEQWQAWHLPSKSLKPHIPTKAKFGTSKTFWQNRPCFLFFCQDPNALTCSVAIRNFPGRQLTSSDVTTTCHFFALCGRCCDWARANYRCRSCDQCSNLTGALKENGVPLFLSWICFGRARFFVRVTCWFVQFQFEFWPRNLPWLFKRMDKFLIFWSIYKWKQTIFRDSQLCSRYSLSHFFTSTMQKWIRKKRQVLVLGLPMSFEQCSSAYIVKKIFVADHYHFSSLDVCTNRSWSTKDGIEIRMSVSIRWNWSHLEVQMGTGMPISTYPTYPMEPIGDFGRG